MAPAGGAQAQGPGQPDGLPRDHQGRDPGRRRQPPRAQPATWSTPRRPAASSTASTATRSRRSCGRRSCRGCRPAACSRSRPGSSWSGSASASRSASAEYWDLTGTFATGRRRAVDRLGARLIAVDGAGSPRAATSTPTGSSRRADVVHLDEADARALAAALDGAGRSRSARVESKPYRRSPYAPFLTTTLQQEAGRKLGFGAKAHHAGGAEAVRERLHHLHAYGLHDAVGDRDRRRPRAGRRSCTAPTTCRRAPRATPARSRTRRRRTRRSAPRATSSAPRPRRRRADRRPVPALRADLEAHRRLADEGRGRQTASPSGSARSPPTAGTPSSPRPARSSPSTASSRRTSRAPTTATPSSDDDASAGCRRWPRATPLTADELDRRRPRHQAARPLHRGIAGQGAGGARDRPPVDVRLDHRHDPRPRLRLQEGHRARPVVPRLRRGQPAGEALRPARRLRLHRRDGGRPRPHRRAARPRPCRG